MTSAPSIARRSRWLLTRADWVEIRMLLVFAVVLFAVPAAIVSFFADPREGNGSFLWEEERMTSLAHETAAEFKDVLILGEEVSGIPPAAEAVGGGFVYIGIRPELRAEAGAICEEFRAAMLRNDPSVMPGFKVIVEGSNDPPAVITAENDYQDSLADVRHLRSGVVGMVARELSRDAVLNSRAGLARHPETISTSTPRAS